MIGNIYKTKTEDLLLRETVIMTIAATGAGGVGSQTYEVPQGRGRVQAIEFSVDTSTLADLVKANFTLQGNGKNLISKESLVTYSPQYSNRWSPFLCQLDEKSTVNISGTNTSTATINVIFTFLYYNPFIMGVAALKEGSQDPDKK